MKISELKKQFEIRLKKAAVEYKAAETERGKIQKEYDKIWNIVCAKHSAKQVEYDRLGKILANINKLEEIQKQEL